MMSPKLISRSLWPRPMHLSLRLKLTSPSPKPRLTHLRPEAKVSRSLRPKLTSQSLKPKTRHSLMYRHSSSSESMSSTKS